MNAMFVIFHSFCLFTIANNELSTNSQNRHLQFICSIAETKVTIAINGNGYRVDWENMSMCVLSV